LKTLEASQSPRVTQQASCSQTSRWQLYITFQTPKRSSNHPGHSFNIMVRLHLTCQKHHHCHQLCLQWTSLEDKLKY
jgi:hypothetical protein